MAEMLQTTLLMYHLSIVIRISLNFADMKSSLVPVKDWCRKSTRYEWAMSVCCEFKLGSMLSMFAIYYVLCTML